MSSERSAAWQSTAAGGQPADHLALRVCGLGKRYALHATPWQRVRAALRGTHPKGAGELWALRDVSFDVARGESFAIVGRNGCGKSTLLEIVAGTLEPTSGEVHVAGQLAALLELGAGFDPALTGRENVHVQAALLGLSRAEIAERFDEIADFAELGRYLEEPVRHYSTGMFVRLAFAVAVCSTPEILVIDEALAVGDEAFQRRCFGRIERMKADGVTLLFVSHAASAVLELCDRALLLDGGEALVTGSPRDVLARYHRLIYAPAARQAELREEIRQQGRSGELAQRSDPAASDSIDTAPAAVATRPLEEERFDAGLESKSRVDYASHGAHIEDVRIETPDGRRVNVLHRGAVYHYVYRVRFERAAVGVRFGMMIKNLVGTELGGVADAPPDSGGRTASAGERVDVRLPFRARLLPGSYFANAGVVAVDSGEELFLHRIMDVLVFRVSAESGLRATGTIDLSTDGPVAAASSGVAGADGAGVAGEDGEAGAGEGIVAADAPVISKTAG